jgi:DNA-binding NarL/FixJ family response regulator
MMMPVMGGLEFMKHFAKTGANADVIVFSNLSATDQINAIMSLGAKDYWIKSDCTPEMIVQRINQRWGDGSLS